MRSECKYFWQEDDAANNNTDDGRNQHCAGAYVFDYFYPEIVGFADEITTFFNGIVHHFCGEYHSDGNQYEHPFGG